MTLFLILLGILVLNLIIGAAVGAPEAGVAVTLICYAFVGLAYFLYWVLPFRPGG